MDKVFNKGRNIGGTPEIISVEGDKWSFLTITSETDFFSVFSVIALT